MLLFVGGLDWGRVGPNDDDLGWLVSSEDGKTPVSKTLNISEVLNGLDLSAHDKAEMQLEIEKRGIIPK
jgi:hypothetical protein